MKKRIINLTTGKHIALLEHIIQEDEGLKIVYSVEMDGYCVEFAKIYPLCEGNNNDFRDLCYNLDAVTKDENGFVDLEKLYFRKVAVNMIEDQDGNLTVGDVTKCNVIRIEGRNYE